MKHAKGFTLIELLIVVAIIGILTAIGVPQYQNYVAKSQVAEGFTFVGSLKNSLVEYHSVEETFPDGTTDANAAIGVDADLEIKGDYISKVEISNDGLGTITGTFGPNSRHDGKFLRLTPTVADGAISFSCTTDIEEPYRPSSCEESTDDPIEEKKWANKKKCPTSGFPATNLAGNSLDNCKNDCGALGKTGCCFFNTTSRLCQFRAGANWMNPASSGNRRAMLF